MQIRKLVYSYTETVYADRNIGVVPLPIPMRAEGRNSCRRMENDDQQRLRKH